jgi:hypothetical protein
LKASEGGMDGKLVKDFIEAVKKQTRLYAGIKSLIEDKASAIKAGDAKKTEMAAEKEENSISAISRAGEDIKNIFKKLSEAAGYAENKKADIGDVLLKLDRESAAEVEKVLAGLSRAVSGVAGLNARNAYLLKNRLQFAGFSAAAKHKLEQPENTLYGRDGAKKTEKSKGNSSINRTI